MQALNSVLSQIAAAQAEFHRKPGEVGLLAVSKAQPTEKIKALYAAGQRRFGENYLQEAVEKIKALSDLGIEWHFIGSIQSNKTQAIASHFDWVQSVSSIKIAERLNAQRPEDRLALNVCIQVNISEDKNKSGVMASSVGELAEKISGLKRLRLRGIMIIPKITDDIKEKKKDFLAAKKVYDMLIDRGFALDTLSMGMSADFKIAIECGSTMVRIGTALFGLR